MTTVELGANREIWLATVADPATKYSFLVRDETYSKSSSLQGRSVRLGEPINLSANSNWTTSSWEGGVRQNIWRDKAMFQEGSADGNTKKGKLQMWPGWKSIPARPAGSTYITRYVFCRSAIVPGESGTDVTNANDVPLYLGEGSFTGATPGQYQLIRYLPATGQVRNFFPPGITEIGPITGILPVWDNTYNTKILAVTYQKTSLITHGKLWFFNEITGAWYNDTAYTGGTSPEGLVNFGDAMYFLTDTSLVRRKAGSFGIIGVYNNVKTIGHTTTVRGLTIWNNRMWFAANLQGGKCAVYVSDGTTTSTAFEFPDTFETNRMVAHYGSLYIQGTKAGGVDGVGKKLQVWKYTGASLTKLYEEGIGNDGEDHGNGALCTQGPLLIWGHNGVRRPPTVAYPDLPAEDLADAGSNIMRPGLMCYNAETDAIFEGPSLEVPDTRPNSIRVSNVYSWNNTLVASFNDSNNYAVPGLSVGPQAVAFVRRGDQMRHDINTPMPGVGIASQMLDRTQFVTSSRFDGTVPGEEKTWLTARVFLKIDSPDAKVDVQVLLDQSTTPITIGTINYDSTKLGYRTVILPIKSGGSGAYLRSYVLQYKLTLHNTGSSLTSQGTPIIDSVDIEYAVSPDQRREWNFRILATNGQLRLDGTANPLTTSETMEAALETLWGGQAPLLFWEASTTPGTPVSSGTEVQATKFSVNSWRLESDDTQVGRDIQLSLSEIVQS